MNKFVDFSNKTVNIKNSIIMSIYLRGGVSPSRAPTIDIHLVISQHFGPNVYAINYIEKTIIGVL